MLSDFQYLHNNEVTFALPQFFLPWRRRSHKRHQHREEHSSWKPPTRGDPLERLHPDNTRKRPLTVVGPGCRPGCVPDRNMKPCPRGSIGPTALGFGHRGDGPYRSSSSACVFIPFILNVGLRKARRGISPGRGNKKWGRASEGTRGVGINATERPCKSIDTDTALHKSSAVLSDP
jgi:hypothetical protein